MAEKKNTPIVVSLVDDTGEPVCPFCGGKYEVRGAFWLLFTNHSFYSNQEADAYIRGKKRV